MPKQIKIPLYFAESQERHYQRIIDNCAPVRRSDNRTCEAIRLGRQELRKLRRYIDNLKNENDRRH